MIALEILDYFRSEQIANGCTPFLLEMYNEATAEQEALRTKSCDGCKYEHKDAYSLPCAACVRNCDSDYYEPKEQ